jgi:hypothetical protein
MELHFANLQIYSGHAKPLQGFALLSIQVLTPAKLAYLQQYAAWLQRICIYIFVAALHEGILGLPSRITS